MHRLCGFTLAHLSGLSQLQELALPSTDLADCDAPATWQKLRALDLSRNCLQRLPGSLSALSALEVLDLQHQVCTEETSFQISAGMHFVTQLHHLREVRLGSPSHLWDAASQFALMQARLLIRSSPGCHVQLVEK